MTLALLVLTGCGKFGEKFENKEPDIAITSYEGFDDSELLAPFADTEFIFQQRIFWNAWDEDGLITGFAYRVKDQNGNPIATPGNHYVDMTGDVTPQNVIDRFGVGWVLHYKTNADQNLPLDHPVNAAYEAATADIADFNLVDPFHLKATGTEAVNYNRDVEAFPLLQRVYEKITGSTIIYRSPTEMGVNRIADGIVDDGAIREAAEQELIRRYFRYRCEYVSGLVESTAVAKAESLLEQYGLSPERRSVVLPAREEKGGAAGRTPQGSALELPDGRIVRGRTSDLMSAASALVLNASKALSGLPREMHLLSPGTISSIARLKSTILGTHNPGLDLEEVLIALSVSAMTSPAADLAMKSLSSLRGCDAHLTSLPSAGDGSGLRELGINVTSDPG
ncbi:MAG TPA: DUF1846 family protein, partial [Bacteroidales bacterium]|nr:DUF1846 family protein [Bacteroidales bacterium]